MNAKTSVFFICVDAIVYLSLYHLYDRTFKPRPKCNNQLAFVWKMIFNPYKIKSLLN